LDGYFSLQFYEDKYPSKVLSILEGDTEYKRIETNDWLSMYEAAKIPDYTTDTWMQLYPVRAVEPNLYTVLINKVKILNVKYDYFGLFTDIIPQEIGGKVVGFQATFTTNSPFAWTNVIAQNIETTGSDSIAFNVQNAERYRTSTDTGIQSGLMILDADDKADGVSSYTRTEIVTTQDNREEYLESLAE
jgi:hypothetical protein